MYAYIIIRLIIRTIMSGTKKKYNGGNNRNKKRRRDIWNFIRNSRRLAYIRGDYYNGNTFNN